MVKAVPRSGNVSAMGNRSDELHLFELNNPCFQHKLRASVPHWRFPYLARPTVDGGAITHAVPVGQNFGWSSPPRSNVIIASLQRFLTSFAASTCACSESSRSSTSASVKRQTLKDLSARIDSIEGSTSSFCHSRLRSIWRTSLSNILLFIAP